MVVDCQNSRKGFLQQAVHSFEVVSANKGGTVVNNIEGQKSSYYEYDRKYRSKSGTEEGSLRTTQRASGEMR